MIVDGTQQFELVLELLVVLHGGEDLERILACHGQSDEILAVVYHGEVEGLVWLEKLVVLEVVQLLLEV